MGYVYLVLVALLFSFGGSCVKLISPYYAPSMISFFRFAVGVGFLLLLKAIKRQPFRADLAVSFRKNWTWLVLGAMSKLGAYLTENTALSLGVSYGNILTQPAQMILLTVIGVLVLGEKLTISKTIGLILCVLGILSISLNGKSFAQLVEGDFMLTLLYIVSGMMAGMFVFVQKKVSGSFDILDSNLIMFAMAAGAGFVPPLLENRLLPASPPDLKAVFAILLFGMITGIGFYLNAKAIPLVPFFMVPLLQSTMVFFSMTWGVLFFHEPITLWILTGAGLFVAGIILMQMSRTCADQTMDTDSRK